MLTEIHFAGVLFAPIVVYAMLALPITLLLRVLAWRCGLTRWFWHPPMAELALYVCVLSLLVTVA